VDILALFLTLYRCLKLDWKKGAGFYQNSHANPSNAMAWAFRFVV
jgi:hypothetical protein